MVPFYKLFPFSEKGGLLVFVFSPSILSPPETPASRRQRYYLGGSFPCVGEFISCLCWKKLDTAPH